MTEHGITSVGNSILDSIMGYNITVRGQMEKELTYSKGKCYWSFEGILLFLSHRTDRDFNNSESVWFYKTEKPHPKWETMRQIYKKKKKKK